MDYSLPGSSVHGILQAMRIEPMSSALQADSLPTWEAYMKKLSTGTVLLFHSSSPKNICTF